MISYSLWSRGEGGANLDANVLPLICFNQTEEMSSGLHILLDFKMVQGSCFFLLVGILSGIDLMAGIITVL